MTPAHLAATMRAIREPGNPADVSKSARAAAGATQHWQRQQRLGVWIASPSPEGDTHGTAYPSL
ncbi:conserved protein of unknown function [Ectopseudomonas oleovorans]|uniref:Uncharacterized protein n=1 Tax=Ectopseudomonas oleovorans TaxID=301 RepID=A0A653B535_ECTOL|nr:conserved protein of unknown function [Pseudomonas oleovorans]